MDCNINVEHLAPIVSVTHLVIMSNFFSLDDDDDRLPDQTDQRSQLQSRAPSQAPSDRSTSRSVIAAPHGRTGNSSVNPIYGMLGEDSRARNGVDERMAVGESSSSRHNAPPIMQLQRAWISERAAPEILPWQGHAVDDVCSQIEEQMVSRMFAN
jgi:hypothetical protein